MNNSNIEDLPQPTLLTAVRDNLLKPMANEICQKNQLSVESLNSKIQKIYFIIIINAVLMIALIILLCMNLSM